MSPAREHRVVIRYEGPGGEKFRQPTQEQMDRATGVVVLRFVAEEDGRPVTPEEIARRDTSEGQLIVGGRY